MPLGELTMLRQTSAEERNPSLFSFLSTPSAYANLLYLCVLADYRNNSSISSHWYRKLLAIPVAANTAIIPIIKWIATKKVKFAILH